MNTSFNVDAPAFVPRSIQDRDLNEKQPDSNINCGLNINAPEFKPANKRNFSPRNNPYDSNTVSSRKTSAVSATSPNSKFAHLRRVENMKPLQLSAILKSQGLLDTGCEEVLRTRLSNYIMHSEQLESSHSSHRQSEAGNSYRYLIFVDFEATCDAKEKQADFTSYPHEIIEFPMVVYDFKLQKVVDTFHQFCRPQFNPKLTDFCLELTKISQAVVDQASPFPAVLAACEQWLQSRGLLGTRRAVDGGPSFRRRPVAGSNAFTEDLNSFSTTDLVDVENLEACEEEEENSTAPWTSSLLVSDCNADMARFMRLQCHLSGLGFPDWARQWINLRKAFTNFYGLARERKITLGEMLAMLGLQFDGQPHRGIDDTLNLLRIARQMQADGWRRPWPNECINLNKPPHYTDPLTRGMVKTLGREGSLM